MQWEPAKVLMELSIWPPDVPMDTEPWKNMEKWAELSPSLQPNTLPLFHSEVDGDLFFIRQALAYESCGIERVCLLVTVGQHNLILC